MNNKFMNQISKYGGDQTLYFSNFNHRHSVLNTDEHKFLICSAF